MVSDPTEVVGMVGRPGTSSVELLPEDADRPARRLTGRARHLVRGVAAAVTVFAVWQALRPLPEGSQYYLVLFLAGTLPLVFLCFRADLRVPGVRPHHSNGGPGPTLPDWVLAAVTAVVCLYPVQPWSGGGYDAFLDRQGRLSNLDLVMGVVLLGLILEAVRRTAGWVLPGIGAVFLAYAYYGGQLPQSWAVAHAGLDVDQIVDALYNSGSGFFGTPLDVAATYIVLFALYGAVLEASGAGQFFVDLAGICFRRSRTAAARTTVGAGFLLGTVSGSGTATAVTVGSTTWPILRRAGYGPDQGAGMLAAAGVGAILSPPTLGAAAFIVAEYVGVSYLTVVGWALIPTLLYYLGILWAVELDARRQGLTPVAIEGLSWTSVLRRSYHLISLGVVVGLLLGDHTVSRSVLWGTLVAFLLSFLDRERALTPRRILDVLADTTQSILAVVAVCAAAGVITAVTTKTGLGSQLSDLIVDAASVFGDEGTVVIVVTAVLSALALTLLGLAVPVTASFIIGWAVIAPALLSLGVSQPAVAMFVFYYSVLSEVTPPTALAAVGACAITGGRPIPAMTAALRYALPAFVVPLAFVVSDRGEHLLGRGDAAGVALVGLCAGFAVVALGIAAAPVGWAARAPALAAVPGLLSFQPVAVLPGLGLLAVAGILLARSPRPAELQT